MASMFPPVGAPPVQPPELPTLSGMNVGGPTAPPGAGQVGALPKLFFNVEQELEAIARVLPPDLATEIGPITSQLRMVLVKALQSGAGAASPNPSGAMPGRPDTSMQFP